MNTYSYGLGNPLTNSDQLGLYTLFWHIYFTNQAALNAGLSKQEAAQLADAVASVDFLKDSQSRENAIMHAMCPPGESRHNCTNDYENYVQSELNTCTAEGLAKAIHAVQDFYAQGHGLKTYKGAADLLLNHPSHIYYDENPSAGEKIGVPLVTENVIKAFQSNCGCKK